MKIDTFTDEAFGVNTYLLVENSNAVLIDPILVDNLVRNLEGIKIDFAILTHEHYDHILGVNELKRRFGTKVICGEHAAERLKDPLLNLSRFQDYIVQVIPFGNGKTNTEEYSCMADQTVTDGQIILWEGHKLLIKESPGHSVGSICVRLDDDSLFSGDTIFHDYPTATRLPGGSTKKYKQITEPWLNSLPQNIQVFPGHGESFLLKERYKT